MRWWLSLVLVWGTTVSAQDSPAAAAQSAASALGIASALLDTAGTKRDRVAALTATVQAYEAGLVAMRDGLRRAAIREQTIATALDAKSAEVGQLLGVLQAMGRAPAPLLMLHPTGPIGTARGGMIGAGVTPALQSQVEELKLQLEELAALSTLQASAVDTLAEGLAGAQEARARLSAAISDRTDLPQRFTEDPVQTALMLAAFPGHENWGVSGWTAATPDPCAPGNLWQGLRCSAEGRVLEVDLGNVKSVRGGGFGEELGQSGYFIKRYEWGR